MSRFIVRIELHDAKWADYDTLHDAMQNRGFARLIKGDDGKTYHLPWAEYTGVSDLTCGGIRDIAREVANTTGKNNSVLATEGTSFAWVGLTEAGK